MNRGMEALFLSDVPWALETRALSALVKTGTCALTARSKASAERRPGRAGRKIGYIAVIPVRGVITNREDLRQRILGGTSIQTLKTQFRQALNDPTIVAIVFDFDSPGGEIAGTIEFASEVFRSRSVKKIVSVANSSALGSAYWLASAAGELAIAPSGEVGSIGVAVQHEDYSVALAKAGVKATLIKAGKFKTDGNPYESLAPSARADMQQRMDDYYGMFVDAVARGRGTSAKRVGAKFGQGRSVLARGAFASRMVDAIETLDETISRIASGTGTGLAKSASFRRYVELFG